MFGHLQVTSSYSFQNSTIQIEELCQDASRKGIQALALCDHNSMYGTMEFYKTCKKYQIKPILGMLASVSLSGEAYSFILLAKNTLGYKDLVKVASIIGCTKSHSIELTKLQNYAKHLYILSSGEGCIFESLCLKEMEDQVQYYLKQFKQLFGHSFGLCIQNHGIALQQKNNERLVALAKLCDVPVCCSNDVRYLDPSHSETLELLQASSSGRQLDNDFEVRTNEQYLKTEAQMSNLFSKEQMDYTKTIVSMCNASIPEAPMNLPSYNQEQIPDGDTYLKQLCMVGLKKRKNNQVSNEYLQRLQKELDVIIKMGFTDYFLIVFDYVRFAKKKGILVGPGRGSAAGSLVSYCLGITNIDPIPYGLLFERFLNEERISMPDIDIDFQDERRDEVIEYVMEKYGKEHVAQIVTFSTYGPKVAIRDLGKVLQIPAPRLEILTKMIPTNPKERKTIYEMMETSYAFSSMVNKDPALQKLIQSAILVEKLPRNISTHAGGIVLSKDPLYDLVPITKGGLAGYVSQYSKDYIEEIGLIKMDFLGLKNLSVLHNICQSIQETKGITIDLNTIPFNDARSYQLLANGDTFGIFQLESPGMRKLLQDMHCSKFEDIIDALALYRPGPMKDIPTYIARKFQKEQVIYPLKELEGLLKPTYGILIFQEQIIEAARIVAGFSLARADVLRKAISKKERKLIQSLKVEFLEGSLKQGFNQQQVQMIYELIEKFADYGFNKSHSVAYSYIAYQLAYLKMNYPLEFFSAILSNEQGSEGNKARCIQEAKKYHVTILPPSINHSKALFTVEGNAIRYSLLGIKNVGTAGYDVIQKERCNGPFKDIFDFFVRMDASKLNVRMLQSLIMAGAFDEFGYSRATLIENLQELQGFAGLQAIGVHEPPILEIKKEDQMHRLELEKEVLGVYLTTHPITIYKEKLQMNVVPVMDLKNYINQRVHFILSIQRVKKIVDKKGNDMCFIEGYDETGSIEGVVFSMQYARIQDQIGRGRICLFEGTITNKQKLSVTIQDAKRIQ